VNKLPNPIILFSTASVHDVNILDGIHFEPNSFYVMDRGYVDYKRLYKIHTSEAFFVTRAKDNMNYRRLYSHPKDIAAGAIYDQTIKVNNHYASKDYPEKMRRIKFKDDATGKILIFLTNNFHLKAK
jgi:transposase